MDEISSGNIRAHPIVRLVGEGKVLKCLLPLFSVSSWAARNLGS
jgi:hypothetical protein